MFAELRSLPRCAEKLRSLLALPDASDMGCALFLMMCGVAQGPAERLLG
jgi:hypothetical protein